MFKAECLPSADPHSANIGGTSSLSLPGGLDDAITSKLLIRFEKLDSCNHSSGRQNSGETVNEPILAPNMETDSGKVKSPEGLQTSKPEAVLEEKSNNKKGEITTASSRLDEPGKFELQGPSAEQGKNNENFGSNKEATLVHTVFENRASENIIDQIADANATSKPSETDKLENRGSDKSKSMRDQHDLRQTREFEKEPNLAYKRHSASANDQMDQFHNLEWLSKQQEDKANLSESQIKDSRKMAKELPRISATKSHADQHLEKSEAMSSPYGDTDKSMSFPSQRKASLDEIEETLQEDHYQEQASEGQSPASSHKVATKAGRSSDLSKSNSLEKIARSGQDQEASGPGMMMGKFWFLTLDFALNGFFRRPSPKFMSVLVKRVV